MITAAHVGGRKCNATGKVCSGRRRDVVQLQPLSMCLAKLHMVEDNSHEQGILAVRPCGSHPQRSAGVHGASLKLM